MSADATPFIYKLNAMEAAGQSDQPANMNYGAKRKAVMNHVAELERELATAHATLSALNAALAACEAQRDGLQVKLSAAEYTIKHAMAYAKRAEAERDAAYERAAQITDTLAAMMEAGGGELEPGGRLRQAGRSIRSLSRATAPNADKLDYSGAGKISVSVDDIIRSPKVQREVEAVKEIQNAGKDDKNG